MGGREFEHYMENIFEALGYVTRIVGGTGDQGVDLLLRKENQHIAVQCKNYNQPVGNKPIQEVFAGARHHGVTEAWVVAPRGFTKGALELARSTGVKLFDRRSIEHWLKQVDSANSHQRVREIQADLEQKDYRNLLHLYQQANSTLIDHYRAAKQCASEIAYSPEMKNRNEQTRRILHGYLANFRQNLDALEARNPTFLQSKLGDLRVELYNQTRDLVQWAKEHGFLTVGPMNSEEQSSEKPISQARTLPADVLQQPSAPATNESTTRDLIVGDTVTIEGGARVTVHSYQSPIPPPSYKQPEPGYEISAIEVEGCAGPNQENYYFLRSDFYLQMPDNTRLRADSPVAKNPVLHSSLLTPGDCLRGWSTFQTPKDEKPTFVIYTRGHSVIKWAIPEH